ncbi:MAG TPA: non-canonical purine NTP pyrophosphatase [Anaerolineaceae bacterium]|nr:non-canonical purine NTP pyrophosphatase [Anaerolineaceae bacterium]
MDTLLIATGNPGKREEMAAILGSLPIRLALPGDLGLQVSVTESGQTYAENAALKALGYFAASRAARPEGLLTLADDSGLEVDALGGEPGLYSARYAPQPGATDADRRAYLLERLAGKPRSGQPGWRARFRCWVAVTGPGVPMTLFEGSVEGLVIPEERGSGGFGYDPIFWLPEYGQTMAELGPEIKNQISHRARALQAALPFLRQVLAGSA